MQMRGVLWIFLTSVSHGDDGQGVLLLLLLLLAGWLVVLKQTPNLGEFDGGNHPKFSGDILEEYFSLGKSYPIVILQNVL